MYKALKYDRIKIISTMMFLDRLIHKIVGQSGNDKVISSLNSKCYLLECWKDYYKLDKIYTYCFRIILYNRKINEITYTNKEKSDSSPSLSISSKESLYGYYFGFCFNITNKMVMIYNSKDLLGTEYTTNLSRYNICIIDKGLLNAIKIIDKQFYGGRFDKMNQGILSKISLTI